MVEKKKQKIAQGKFLPPPGEPQEKVNTVKQSLKDAANESKPKLTQPAKPPKQGCAGKGEPVDAIHGLVYYGVR